ncbi:YcxB family protein [Asanoa ishikariensis]|uniref:YcxB family protein n=1 Tax=Asanoa ishikariensis TaxID=137265 RepID=UPI0015A031BA|nr:YcxB family protein [Asanoa ishikariensis]
MRIVIVATPDPRRPVAALRHVSRWVFRSFWAVGLLVLALGVVGIVVLDGGDPALDAAIMVIGLLLLASPSFMVASVRRQQRATAGMTIEYEFDEDGVLQRYEDGESRMPWSTLLRAEIFSNTLLLFQARNRYIPIPIGALSPTDRADLRDLLERHGLLPPPRADLWTTSDPASR